MFCRARHPDESWRGGKGRDHINNDGKHRNLILRGQILGNRKPMYGVLEVTTLYWISLASRWPDLKKEERKIPVHAVASGNHKVILNEYFRIYLNHVQNINSAERGSLHQLLQGVFLVLYT